MPPIKVCAVSHAVAVHHEIVDRHLALGWHAHLNVIAIGLYERGGAHLRFFKGAGAVKRVPFVRLRSARFPRPRYELRTNVLPRAISLCRQSPVSWGSSRGANLG